MKKTLSVIIVAIASSCCFSQSYRFKIDPERTFTDGTLQLRYWSHGSMTGDFDQNDVPNGTRTIVSSSTQRLNESVSVKPVWEFFRRAVFRTDGSFDLTVNLTDGTATLERFVTERLVDGPLEVEARCTLENEPFDVFSPDAKVGGSIPQFAQPMVLDRLKVTQRPGPRNGTVTELSDGWYRVSITFMADVLTDVLDLGQSGPLTFPMAASLVGDVRITNEGAEFGYIRGQGGDNWTRDVNQKLDPFKILVPVNLEQRGRMSLDTTIKRVSVAINGLRQFYATGQRL